MTIGVSRPYMNGLAEIGGGIVALITPPSTYLISRSIIVY